MNRSASAPELHDSLGQELTGLAYLTAGLRSKLRATAADLAVEAAALEAVARNAIDTCRVIAHGMSPAGADAGGLVQAVREPASRLEKLHPVRVVTRRMAWVYRPEAAARTPSKRNLKSSLRSADK